MALRLYQRRGSTMTSQTILSKMTGVGQLITAISLICLMTFVVLPALTRSFTSFSTLAAFIDSSGIDTGQFYYTDVEIVTQADIGARSSIQFYQNRMKLEKMQTAQIISEAGQQGDGSNLLNKYEQNSVLGINTTIGQ